MAIPFERVRELLDYNPFSGLFIWRASRRRARKGDVAGSLNADGYVRVKLDGTHYFAHRLAVLWMTGAWPVAEVDHENCVRTDNRWVNLRNAGRADNARNTLPRVRDLPKGVTFDNSRGLYLARICVNRREINLGRFVREIDAAEAYAVASAALHREFGRTDAA